MAELLASPDWDRKVVGSNPGVARSDGICKYLSCLSLTLIVCVRLLFPFVLSYDIVDTWRLVAALKACVSD